MKNFYQIFSRNIWILFFISTFFLVSKIHAKEKNEDEFFIGTVKQVENFKSDENSLTEKYIIQQKIKLLINNKTVNVNYAESAEKKLKKGDRVVVKKAKKAYEGGEVYYEIFEKYRSPWVIGFFIFVLLLAILLTGKRGFFAILGLFFSALVLFYYIIPQILAGRSPLLICTISSILISFVSLYITHGIKKTTTIAFLGICSSIFLAILFSFFVVYFCDMYGFGSGEAPSFQSKFPSINLQGILLGGMIIGAIGVLDDITTVQSMAIYEIKKTNKKLNFRQLFDRGYSIGKEHILSLINTLILAYAGSSFILFIMLASSDMPFFVILNSEVVSEEIVRMLVGSFALILAVPITTLLAAYYFRE